MDKNAIFQHLLARTVGDLGQRLEALHGVVQSRYEFVSRMAIALFDSGGASVCTFFSSEQTLHVEASQLELDLEALGDAQSLLVSRREGDSAASLTVFGQDLLRRHLRPSGFLSSYTYPICVDGAPIAVLLFEARVPHAFSPPVVEFLDPLAQVVVDLFLLRTKEARGLIDSVELAVGLMQARDVETGQHLARMSDYAAIIAEGVADAWRLDETFVDHLALLAPLHDIGKVGIPDAILLKPGPLDEAEWTTMRRHVLIGKDITDRMITDLGAHGSMVAARARNIVLWHHERGDGSGYPHGLKMAAIPPEARIVAVADVYDTLASSRAYKQPRPEAECVAILAEEASAGRLDADCVAALIDARERRRHVRHTLRDVKTGPFPAPGTDTEPGRRGAPH